MANPHSLGRERKKADIRLGIALGFITAEQ
jgi:hypothetical protein